jgi:hypothetical protein
VRGTDRDTAKEGGTMPSTITIFEALHNDVQFLHSKTENDRGELLEHLFFAVAYFYANHSAIAATLDALFALPEEKRKEYDPYPHDRAWMNSEKNSGYVAISQRGWRNVSGGGVADCPISNDNINMLIRALRIAERAPIKIPFRHLLLSPVEHFYETLRAGDAWRYMVPGKLSRATLGR